MSDIGAKISQQIVTWATNTLQNTLKSAISYASEYYDLMNEIRIVSGYNEEQAKKLGVQYRKMAQEMSVSSVNIAEAAVEFWRQGLNEDETNNRIIAATQYAKISSLEFAEAAELITAATNTMGISAQHVADIFAYLGDESASGADEIGTAMQKASASAEEFGVSFEWLGSYIATVSEQTRQAPEVIGTAINSIMSRMHAIKQKGFNEEDETKINDVAKALGTLGITLLDEEDNWRSMQDIMIEISEQWDRLTGKERSYIATVMAGTQQRNTFLALMNDMSKGLEGGSRAFELYEGSMTAAGTAAQKYSIYMESVEAAQGRFEAALESLYGLLDANWMKGAYDGLAGFVDLITRGTEAMNGLNVTIPATALALGAVAAVIVKIVSVVQKLIEASNALNKAMSFASILSGGSIGAIVAGVAGLAALVTTIIGAAKKASEVKMPDYTEQLSNVTSYVDTISPLIEEYNELSAKQKKTESDTKRMDEIFAQLSGTSYTLQTRLEGLGGQYGSNSKAVQVMNEELKKQIDLQNSLAQMDAFSKFGEQVSNLKTAYEDMNSIDVQKMILDEWNNYINEIGDPEKATQWGFGTRLSTIATNYNGDASLYGKNTEAGKEAERQAESAKAAYEYVFALSGDIQAEMRNLDTIVVAGETSAAAKINDEWKEVTESLSTFAKDSALLDMPADATQNLESFVETVVSSLRDSVDGNIENLTEDMLKDAAGLIQRYKDVLVQSMADTELTDALPENFKESLTAYSDELFGFLQKLYSQNPAAVTEELLASVAEMFTVCRDTLAELATTDGFSSLMDEYNKMMETPETATFEEYKEIAEGINKYISEYNAQVEAGEIEGAKITLVPEWNEEEFEQWQENAKAALESVGDEAEAAAAKVSDFSKYYTEWLTKQEATNAAKNGYKDTAEDILSKSINSETGTFDVSLYQAAMDAAYKANSELIEGMAEAFPMFGEIYNGLVEESEAYSYLQKVIDGTAMAYETERAAMAENLAQQEALTKAKEEGFKEQISLLTSLIEDGEWTDIGSGGYVISDGGLDAARREFNSWTSDMQEAFAEAQPELYAVLMGVTDVTDETQAWEQALAAAGRRIRELSFEEVKEATETLLKQAAADTELENAKANNYIDQVRAGQNALTNGFQYIDENGLVTELAAGEEAFRAWWSSLSEDMREGITATYPEIAKMAIGFEDVAPSVAGIGAALDRVRETSLKEFNDAISGGDSEDVKRINRLQNAYNGVTADGKRRADGLSGQAAFQAESLALFSEDQSGMIAFVQNNKALMALKDGYADAGTAAQLFTDATYRAKYSSIEATEALIQQQKAAELAAEEEENNYAQTSSALKELFASGDNEAVLQYWEELPEDLREGFSKAYPEAAALITRIFSLTNAAEEFSEAIQSGLDRLEAAAQNEFFKEQSENADTAAKKKEAEEAADNRYTEQFGGLQDIFMGAADIEDKAAAIEALREKIYEMYSENSELAEGFRDEYGDFWNILFSDDADWEDIVSAYLEALEQCRNSLQLTADTLYESANGTAEYNAAMEQIQDALDTGSEEAFIKVWNSLGKAVQDALLDSSDAVKDYVTSLAGLSDAHEDAISVAKKLTREGLAKEGAQLTKQNKIWDEAVDVIEDSGKAQATYLKSINSIGTKLNNLALAQADLATAMDTTKAGTDAYNTALANLETYCGFAINSEYDLAMAAALLAGDTDMATSSVEWLINAMLTLTGIDLNPSTWIAQLQALVAQNDLTAQAVLNLIEQLAQVNGATVSLNKDGKVVVSNLGSKANGTRTSSSSRRSSGGGGGGSSRRSTEDSDTGSSSAQSTERIISEIERLLDVMEQIQTIQNFKREIIDLQKAYYESRGEIQGVLKCIEYEKQAIEANTLTLQGNLGQLEALMEAKRAEVNAMDTSAEGYSDAADELKSLQNQHMEYSKQLLQNRNDLESLNKEIKEWKNKIRQMEIDLRELILSAIEDREEMKERMLQGTIEMENEIIDVIKARYEKERDEILETTDAKKTALEEEKQMLKEQLDARKEAQAEEEKMVELQQMEAKLARITADPTRKKEALELQKKIKDLRDEIAWDSAEKEVEAQQNAIDEQINSTEEYADYIKNYYEEMLENPRNFIEEVQRLLLQSDEEIIQWLKDNNEDFKNSTDAARTDMVNGWQDTLNDMHGAIVTYWDEVEEIIEKGDDAIIQFLMDNSADYKAAGKLQAEAYVDEWKEQLENLRNAYKDVAVDISTYDYQVVAPASSSIGGDNGYSGASNNSSPSTGPQGGKTNPTTSSKNTGKAATLYKFVFNGATYSGYQTSIAARNAAQQAAQNWYNNKMAQSGGKSTGTQEYAAMQRMLTNALNSISSYSVPVKGTSGAPSSSKNTLVQYASGGMNTSTGPAWLDGTPQKPERILSPYQTELFEDMIATLHAIKTISAPTMPAFGADTTSRSQPAMTFGDVIIQVDRLDNDTDYDELAEKFFDHVLEKSGRVQSVGGIRLSK